MNKNDALKEAMKLAEMAALESVQADQIYGVRTGTSSMAPWPAQPARIIFLDFDGVLNSEQSFRKFGTRYRFAGENVAALNEVLQQTGAGLVITSSWREGLSLAEMIGYLERDGVLAKRVVGKTPQLQKSRGLEIDSWLRSAPYPISSFVILDDRDDMEMHRERLVQVDPQIGLCMSQARVAIQLIARPN